MTASTTLPRKTIVFYAIAALCVIASIFVAQWQIGAQSERSEIRKSGQRVTAVAVSRKEIEFTSTKGRIVTHPLVSPLRGTLNKFDSITVIYDRDNPKRVVLEQDDTAFNMTIWIVVIKLFGAAGILVGLGYRKQRKAKIS